MLKKRKAPDPIGLTPDSIISLVQHTPGLEVVEERLEDMKLSTKIAMVNYDNVKCFWDGECSIAEWKIGTLAPVPKSGNLSDPNKWRPVCLLETTYKILASVIAFRINPIVRNERMEEQCRSLSCKGCQGAPFFFEDYIETQALVMLFDGS